MKLILAFFILCITNSVSGQRISFEDYFPLKKGMIRTFYVSHITETDTIHDIDDSSICKSKIIKGKEIFYFSDHLYDDSINIIDSRSFANGVSYYENGEFFISPITWEYELQDANLDYFEALFPKKLKMNFTYFYRDGEEKIKYKFTGLENVFIKDKVFNNCLKLIIQQDWPTAQYFDTVWFQKGVGVVKWLRSTGRLEEIRM